MFQKVVERLFSPRQRRVQGMIKSLESMDRAVIFLKAVANLFYSDTVYSQDSSPWYSKNNGHYFVSASDAFHPRSYIYMRPSSTSILSSPFFLPQAQLHRESRFTPLENISILFTSLVILSLPLITSTFKMDGRRSQRGKFITLLSDPKC